MLQRTRRILIGLVILAVALPLFWVVRRHLGLQGAAPPAARMLADDSTRPVTGETTTLAEAEARTAASIAPSNPAPDNPFVNTCDGRSIGFVGPTGEAPRMAFSNIAPGAVLMCRSGPSGEVGNMAFAPCDGAGGTTPFHTPQLTVEGTYQTEMREMVGTRVRATTRLAYYVHHSLDGVNCCRSAVSDAAWFDAARAHLAAAGTFTDATRTANPFITVAARTEAGGQAEEMLSLRRTFRLSEDRNFLLIRRTMCSRRTLALENRESCVGLTISVPEIGVDSTRLPICPPRRERHYFGGLVDAECPGIYCTVTTCRTTADGCTAVTYTFNRGPQQAPWVVEGPIHCPPRTLLSFTDYHCDAYVLNGSGQGVCLAHENGVIRALVTLQRAPLGLAVLAAQRGAARSADRYVFSLKTTMPTGDPEVLYLPR